MQPVVMEFPERQLHSEPSSSFKKPVVPLLKLVEKPEDKLREIRAMNRQLLDQKEVSESSLSSSSSQNSQENESDSEEDEEEYESEEEESESDLSEEQKVNETAQQPSKPQQENSNPDNPEQDNPHLHSRSASLSNNQVLSSKSSSK